MPLQKITLKPGVNRENTRYTNEGGWYESNLVRFRQGTPEKMGGWMQISASTFAGVCRSLWNWVTLKSLNLLGVGTDKHFYIENGGSYYDVTPFRVVQTLTNPFATTIGSPVVTVTDVNSGYRDGDTVTFYNATAVGGLTLNGQYTLTYTTGNTYTITASSNASSTTTGGGTVYAVYQLNNGTGAVAALVGWGSGSWGSASWGTDGASTSTTPSLLVWNQSNFGQDLLYGQRGGALYYWSANIGVTASTVTISAATPGVVSGLIVGSLIEGQSIMFGTTGTLPSPLIPGTVYYVKSLVSTTCNLAATAGGAAINTSGGSGTHSILPNGVPVSTLNGISAGPPLSQNFFLISDASRFVIVFGTNPATSTTFDPLQIRWSDQESMTSWYPSATNQAGGIRLSHGSKIVTAIQSRQEILVFTDQSLHSMQYVGPPAIWGTQLLADNVSIISPYAAASASNVTYWMGADKFYYYDGRVNTLNCDLRSYIYGNINQAQAEQCFAGTNEGFNEVWFFYPSASSTTIDSYVVYNYLEKVWYFGSLARTAWLDSGLRAYPMAATYSSNVVYHEDGIDDGTTGTLAPINAYITSSQFDIGDGDSFAFIRRMLPDLTFHGSTAVNPTITMYLQPLKNSGSGYTTPASVAGPNSDGSAVVTGTVVPVSASQLDQFNGQVYIRVRGRQMSIKIASSGLGVQWQMGSPRIDIRPDGRRA
jgi:hypothetical protein